MVVPTFFMLDKDGKVRFSKESFFLTDIKPNIMLNMSFLTINNLNVDFKAEDLQWEFYTIKNIPPTTKNLS